MAQCTAPSRGHRSSSAAANCPACRGGWGRSRSYSYSPPSYSYSAPSYSSGGSGGSRSSGGGYGGRLRPRWSSFGSPVTYTEAQVRSLTPIRESVEKQAAFDLRDVFLCHAWDDRQGPAKELHDLLEAKGVKVWFSEKDIQLGVPMMRAIDKGLAASRVGIVLVTPAMLRRLPAEGIADKELSVLLRTERLIPVMHGTTFEALNNVSPMLASRAGLNTSEEPMNDVATKLAELVKVGDQLQAA